MISSNFLLPFLILQLILTNVKCNLDLKELRKTLPLQQRITGLHHERHRSTKFTFATLNTEVPVPYKEIPSSASTTNVNLLHQLKQTKECKVKLEISVVKFRRKAQRTLCLFKEDRKMMMDIFENPEEAVEFGGMMYSATTLYQEAQPVTGFILGNSGSVVQGYIVDSYFYGTVRLFDKLRGYHLHFYIEPAENIVHYSVKYLKKKLGRKKGDNGIVFEYISHEDHPDEGNGTSTAMPEQTTTTTTTTTTMTTTTTTPQPTTTTTLTTTLATTDATDDTDSIDDSTDDSTGDTDSTDESDSTDDPDSTLSTTPTSPQAPNSESTTISPQEISSTTYDPDTDTDTATYVVYHSTEPSPKRKRQAYQKFRPLHESNPDLNLRDILYPYPYLLHSTEPSLDQMLQARRRMSKFKSRSKRNLPDLDNSEKDNAISLKSINELLQFQDLDIVNRVMIQKGDSNSDMFSPINYQSYTCSLCIWIQPNFAQKFGFDSDLLYGTAEIVEIIKLADWLFRSQDFNNDGLADNLGFLIRTLVITDEFQINATSDQIKKAKSSPYYPLMTNNLLRRKKRFGLKFGKSKSKDPAAFDLSNYNMDPGWILDPDDSDYIDDIIGITEEELNLGPPMGDKDDPNGNYTKMIYTLTAQQAYDSIAPLIQTDNRFMGCCAVLGFIYHNLSPSLSISSLRGACTSDTNIALVSGNLHMHKIGRYDILRSVIHSLAHLFGGHHDKIGGGNSMCSELEGSNEKQGFSNFVNPFVLNPAPQINVGLRPNSMRFSKCTGREIAAFLLSGNPSCLGMEKVEKDGLCGNGYIDTDEECDCGSPWQCHLQLEPGHQCCGERDSLFACKRVDVDPANPEITLRSKCGQPLKW